MCPSPTAALGRETGFHFFIGAHLHPRLESAGCHMGAKSPLSFSSPSSSDALTPLTDGFWNFAVPSLRPSRQRVFTLKYFGVFVLSRLSYHEAYFASLFVLLCPHYLSRWSLYFSFKLINKIK